MKNRSAWVAFLLMCFVLTGLVGLFASYAASIPLERALHRIEALDEATATGTPDDAAVRNVLGDAAVDVLAGPGDLPARLARGRRVIEVEGIREAASVAYRSRLMVVIVTMLAGGLGAGLLLLASRPTPAD